MKNVYTIRAQHDEEKILETYTNLKKAMKELNNFYYWHPSYMDGIMLYKNGTLYNDEACRTNPNYQ